MAEKKNLIKIAKKSTGSKSTTSVKNKSAQTVKPKTPEEERDLKAKEKVNELLKNIDLTNTGKGDNLLIVDDDEDNNDVVDNKSIEWLEEQTSLLSNELEIARAELANLKEINNTLMSKTDNNYESLKNVVIRLFNELQTNHINAGYDIYGNPNFRIRPVAFMNRMVMFFPFLENIKKF